MVLSLSQNVDYPPSLSPGDPSLPSGLLPLHQLNGSPLQPLRPECGPPPEDRTLVFRAGQEQDRLNWVSQDRVLGPQNGVLNPHGGVLGPIPSSQLHTEIRSLMTAEMPAL